MGRGYNRKFGIYATPEGQLTAEGKLFVARWLEEFPNPVRIIKRRYKGLYLAARAWGISDDDMNMMCMETASVSALCFHPDNGISFVTFAGIRMKGRLHRALKAIEKRDRQFIKGIDNERVLLPRFSKVDIDEVKAFDVEICLLERSELLALVCNRINYALESLVVNNRKKEMFKMYYGIIGTPKQSNKEIATLMKCHKSLVTHYVNEVRRRILSDLKSVYEEYIGS
jgi:hypothetical protein